MQKYTCPCCGYKTIERADTFYDLCPVCFWETDPYQLANPTYKGGANVPSLAEAQQNFILFGACEKEDVPKTRMPFEDEEKDVNFQTFDENTQNTEGVLYFKRYWNETTGDPKTDAWGTSWYYFETDAQGDVSKQIVVYKKGGMQKYSQLHLEDAYGGLSEKALDLSDNGYEKMSKSDFFKLWNTSIIETFTAKKVHLAGWHIAVYNTEINTIGKKLTADETLISATLDHRFMLELSYEKGGEHFPRNGFYKLYIKEGHTGIHYFIYMNWDEAATATQQFIDEINEVNKTVDVKKSEEEKAFQVRVSIDNQIVMSKLTTWRNMDWDVEKFRNIQIEINDETYSIIDTFTDFENMLLALHKSLPKNYKIETCFFCRFSSYNPVGNDNFGALDCFKNCKKDFEKVDEKHALFALYEKENSVIFKVEETHYCEDFQLIKTEHWAVKNMLKD
jgi:Cysteine-rich CPCC